ncbi:hypothetical protein BDN72DRAFT_872626 [Pluteus cervinus]|uniref:Uncharacterized protein n=1 Tax=Pluteus cervinus TaxID=181527 RepID=A0ACD3A8T8_9AGAR|nr:hypothetical protein BDN72DRAFT_872626 [Pluteus cervinus]
MYHDKRFQTDTYFPFVAFSHGQIKAAVSGSFVIVDRENFDQISERVLGLDVSVLNDLSERLESGEAIQPTTQKEKDCYDVIRDLDHIGGHVQGSTTSKKYMRNEIWSLIIAKGAPSWFITISPADNKHPLSIYYADRKEKFQPTILEYGDRFRLVCQNPVGAARFFHVMVSLFLKHILGIGTDHLGIYGQTSAYYGTLATFHTRK